jgi:hypothetical protein
MQVVNFFWPFKIEPRPALRNTPAWHKKNYSFTENSISDQGS